MRENAVTIPWSFSPMLLTAKNLSFSYGRHRVLHDVSISLAAGELRTILGPNGSGKSTLLRVLLGQLPAIGTIQWDASDVRQWRPRELAKIVAYLPQSPAFEPGQTVADTLRLGRAPYLGAFGLESQSDAVVVNQIADSLGLSDWMTRPLDTLSGGQRQRVFIGRCLVQQPRALLLDEPSTFLDLRHQIDLWKLLKQIATDQKIAVLAASHDLNLAGAFADQMLLLRDGAEAAHGRPAEVLRANILSEVFETPISVLPRESGGPFVVPRVSE
jgi:iron complex transport system ATP-binding protein